MTHQSLPLVSVIIPCYNRDKYISQTIQSVLMQTWHNIELIVIDDGCTDRSREKLEKFGSDIMILEHPGHVNKGQSAAINLGLQHANGTYVAILDSDDLFAMEKIERQIHFLENHSEFDLVYSNGHYIDEHGNVMYSFYSESHEENSESHRILLDCYFLLPNNALVRRSIYEKIGGFDESLRAAQDHDMAIRIAEVGRIGYIKDYLFFYRRHANSISQKNAKLRWRNGYKILLKAFLRRFYSIKIIIRRLAVLNFRLGQCYLEEKNYFMAVTLFVAAGVCDPLRSIKVLAGLEKISSPH